VSATYNDFELRSSEIIHLRSVLEALSWDQETMMPEAGAAHRAAQVSTIAVLLHQRITDPKFGDLIGSLEQNATLDAWGRASVREAKRQYDRATRVPQTLVKELAGTRPLAYEAWVKARSESDFPSFAPWLEKIVALKRQEAECLREPGGALYDALLDEYEPGMTIVRLDSIFSEVRPRLSRLIARITSSGRGPRPLPTGPFPVQAQESINREILTSMGFNWKAGRLDTSPHPFCSGFSPRDVRMTTRYSTTEIAKALFGSMHECGHALYEQGLPADRYGLPACEAISLGVHESQSRLWENQVGRSFSFWDFWFPKLKRSFAPHFDDFTVEAFVRSVNRVSPSLIRVEADEVTYGLHVILRYELEKALISGSLEVDDLEESWGHKMSEYLDLRPIDSAQGALQDTHWSQGLVGYFPTYLLGNLYASQFYQSACYSLPDLDKSIARGEMLPLREWLRERVHQHGKTVTADELIQRVTGAPVAASHFLDYLDDKFGRLYDL
jgi:carboxypeptidase Taq